MLQAVQNSQDPNNNDFAMFCGVPSNKGGAHCKIPLHENCENQSWFVIDSEGKKEDKDKDKEKEEEEEETEEQEDAEEVHHCRPCLCHCISDLWGGGVATPKAGQCRRRLAATPFPGNRRAIRGSGYVCEYVHQQLRQRLKNL